jgi:hypothetical protein
VVVDVAASVKKKQSNLTDLQKAINFILQRCKPPLGSDDGNTKYGPNSSQSHKYVDELSPNGIKAIGDLVASLLEVDSGGGLNFLDLGGGRGNVVVLLAHIFSHLFSQCTSIEVREDLHEVSAAWKEVISKVVCIHCGLTSNHDPDYNYMCRRCPVGPYLRAPILGCSAKRLMDSYRLAFIMSWAPQM